MQKTYLVEFNNENSEAALFELRSIERSAKDFSIVHIEEPYAIIQGETERVRNSSFVNYISEVLEQKQDWHDFSPVAVNGTYYLRVKDINGCHGTANEPDLGKLVGGPRPVNFKNPDFKLRAFHGKSWYLCLVVYEKDRKALERRRAPLRPFFSPVAIHPKWAMYLVNATETVPGDTILDPFCGTGGVILEAALMGRKTIGNDSSLNMVKGARLNLKYFNVQDSIVYNRDIAELELGRKVDGIATDLPYGRNSNMESESISSLYKTAFSRFHEWLYKGSLCSVVISDKSLLSFTKHLFSIEKIIAVPQHRSLTRYFVAMRRL